MGTTGSPRIARRGWPKAGSQRDHSQPDRDVVPLEHLAEAPDAFPNFRLPHARVTDQNARPRRALQVVA